ncbi:hypothetical protein CP061683_0978A, partial [Chlamydia psittaci 06-1683]
MTIPPIPCSFRNWKIKCVISRL